MTRLAYTPHQRQMIDLALRMTRRDHPRVRKALLEAMAVESTFRHLNYGDRDSVGVLQQRPSQGWGPATETPKQDMQQFLSRARRTNRGFKGTAGQLAQAIQRSAYPGRYDQQEDRVNDILKAFGGKANSAVGGKGQFPVTGNKAVSGNSSAAVGLAQESVRSALAAQMLAQASSTAQGQNIGGPQGVMAMAMARQQAMAMAQPALEQEAGAPVVTSARGGAAVVGPGGSILPIAKGSYTRGGGAGAHGERPLGNWQSDRAVDMMAAAGTPIRAVSDGVISPGGLGFGKSSGKGTVVGNRLHLKTKNNTYFYQHMGSYAPGIRPGARVKKGQVIGYVGDYGSRIGGNHLHFAAQHGNPFGLLYGGRG